MLPLLLAAALAAPGDVAPDRDWDVTWLDLDVAIDPDAGTVAGTVRLTVQPLLPGSTELTLHQRALSIEAVRIDGAASPFVLDDNHLVVSTGPRTGPIEVEVDYRATPRTGLHFRRLEEGSPDAWTEVWSQGEGEDNRYWFPSWDFPNDRFGYSGRFTVPEGYSVLSNGDGGRDGDAWQYRLDAGLVNYLVMVAVGPWEIHETGWRDVVLRQWYASELPEPEIAHAASRLPAMMEFFSERTGLAYPYSSYSQVFIQRFLYTGMENTTATVMDRRVVVPVEDDETAWWSELVIAHELAHQWFGDTLTCRTWHELWLNEGFATFMAAAWMAESRGAAWYASGVADRVEESLAAGPVAGRPWSTEDGEHAPNHSVYTRGAATLHALRVMLGEAAFWAGIQRYTADHAFGLVRTEDLVASFEEVTGHHLNWFFDQWIHRRGSPTLTGRTSWKAPEGDGLGSFELRLKQEGDGLWVLPVDIELGSSEGAERHRVWLDESSAVLVLPLAARPTWVAVDPDGGLIAKLEIDQSTEMWLAQLASPSLGARVQAIRHLGEGEGGDEGTQALLALLDDPDLTWRAEAVEALTGIKSPESQAGLIRALADGTPLVRRMAAKALGQGVDRGDLVAPLTRAVRQESDARVRAGALTSLARHDRKAALRLARNELRVPAPYYAPVHVAAVKVVAEHGRRGDLELLLTWCAPDTPHYLQATAARSALKLAERQEGATERRRAREEVVGAVAPMLDSLHLRTRQEGVRLLGAAGGAEAAAFLDAYAAVETVADAREAAVKAAGEARKKRETPPPEQASVDARLEELEKRLGTLEDELDAVQERH